MSNVYIELLSLFTPTQYIHVKNKLSKNLNTNVKFVIIIFYFSFILMATVDH